MKLGLSALTPRFNAVKRYVCTGTVQQLVGDLIEAHAPSVKLGSFAEIDGCVCEVVGFRGSCALLMPLDRMNNVQLCSTVCLGVAFTVAVEGVMPPESSQLLVNMYSGCIGAAILCLSASLWLSFVLIRRLNLYTAGIMHAMIDMERVKVRTVTPSAHAEQLASRLTDLFALSSA